MVSMTLVNIEAFITALAAPALANGKVEIRYEHAGPMVDGEDIVFPSPISVTIVNGRATQPLSLVPTKADEYVSWNFNITGATDPGKRSAPDFCTTIPATGPVNFGDLTIVDPDTYDVTDETVAAWIAAVQEVDAARDEALAAAALAVPAAATAVSAKDVAVAARADAANYMIQAGQSADAADADAFDAMSAKVAAETAANVALAGQMLGQALPGGTDVNALAASGRYRITGGSGNTEALGYPFAGFLGVIDVFGRQTGRMTQVAWPTAAVNSADSRRFYVRTQQSAGWSTWRTYGSQRIVNPADQPGVEFLAYDDANNKDLSLLTVSTLLGTYDLDVVTVPGFYYQNNGGSATLARHYPVNGGLYVLEVLPVGPYSPGAPVMQRASIVSGVEPTVNRGYFVRRYNGINWGAWAFMATQTVDESAGRAIYTWDQINNRPQLVYGDTGWRDVSGLVLNQWTVPASALRIRRYGALVSLRILAMQSASATDDAFMASIPGFRNSGLQGWHPVATGRGGTDERSLLVREQTGFLAVANRSWVPAAGVYASITWMTDDTWPTTLPGTPVGAIPNA